MIATPHEFISAIRPFVEGLGGTLVAAHAPEPGDLAVEWEGDTIGFVRGSQLHGALDRLIRSVERDIGTGLDTMDRMQKQAAVRCLDERGAFLLRGAVDDIAQSMGVSRVTLYSYLNALNSPSGTR